jgi:hypothetical protein
MEPENENPYAGLFDSISATARKKSPTQMWAADIDLYKSLPKAFPRTDPLLWWKTNQFQFPILGKSCQFFQNFFFPFLTYQLLWQGSIWPFLRHKLVVNDYSASRRMISQRRELGCCQIWLKHC